MRFSLRPFPLPIRMPADLVKALGQIRSAIGAVLSLGGTGGLAHKTLLVLGNSCFSEFLAYLARLAPVSARLFGPAPLLIESAKISVRCSYSLFVASLLKEMHG